MLNAQDRTVTDSLSFVIALERIPDGSGAFVVVFDPSNYSQNILTAARSLEQINNQVKSLENQAQIAAQSTPGI